MYPEIVRVESRKTVSALSKIQSWTSFTCRKILLGFLDDLSSMEARACDFLSNSAVPI
jgi:hypothetical protein